MDFLNNLFSTKPKYTQEQLKLLQVMKYLSLKDLNKITIEYISEDPKVIYKDADGIERSRKPNRLDYENAILNKVAFECILEMYPNLKDKY